MNCGTPVIASNLTSIPEVVGDGGILINPYDISEISLAIGNLLSNENLRAELSYKALKRASEFSWQNTALNTLKVYESVYNINLLNNKKSSYLATFIFEISYVI